MTVLFGLLVSTFQLGPSERVDNVDGRLFVVFIPVPDVRGFVDDVEELMGNFINV
jgi:hypothetical protein